MSEQTTSATTTKDKKPLGRKPVARKDMSKVQWTLKEMKRNYIAYVMCAPYFLIFFLFTVLPVILSIFYSFTIFNLIEPMKWCGFDNYIRLFLDDDIFLIAVQNTLIFAVIIGPVSYFLSLFVAWFINELSPKIRSVVTLIFYAPSISGGATTIWEHWDGVNEQGDMWSSDMNSFNHYAYGSVAQWMYRTVAGIRSDEKSPAYKHFYISPIPDAKLGFVRCRLDTRNGTVTSGWTVESDGTVRYEFEVPEGATATVKISGVEETLGKGRYTRYGRI